MCGMVDNLLTRTMGANFLDHFPPTATLVTSDLSLGVHSREDLLFDDFDACTIATCARMDVAVRRCSRATAMVAQNALLDHELLKR